MVDEQVDEKDLEGDDEEAGGSKKMLIIIVALVVLLAGGGAAAFFLMSGGDASADAEETEQSESSGEEDSEEPTEPQGPAIYHEMSPTFVVNLPPGGRAKMLQVGVQVLTHDYQTSTLLTEHSPMLRHHVFNLFSTQDANGLFGRSGREALQAEIKEEITIRLKPHYDKVMIDEVFFTQFVLQ